MHKRSAEVQQTTRTVTRREHAIDCSATGRTNYALLTETVEHERTMRVSVHIDTTPDAGGSIRGQ